LENDKFVRNIFLAANVYVVVTKPEAENKDEIIARLRARIESLLCENEQLKQRVSYLCNQLYGRKSEKINPNQLELLLDGIEGNKPEAADPCASEDQSAARKSPRKPRQNRLRRSMDQLPVIEERVVAEEVQADPQAYRKIRDEVSERLEVKPAEYFRRRIIREVHQRIDEPGQPPITPPLPKPLLEGSVLSASLLADILDKKYCQHLPFYRQAWILRNAHGLDISRAVLCQWHARGADLLEPLYKLQLARLRACSYLQADETPVDYLDPGGGKTKRGYFWTIYNPTQGVLYQWHCGRGRECLEELLLSEPAGRFRGHLQCDAYTVYQSLSADQQSITLVSCLAHIRRKFKDALSYQPRYAAWVLKQIGRLYAVEAELRRDMADAAQRVERRRKSSRPIYRWLKRAMVGIRAHPSVLPSSPLGKALNYALHQWDLLAACFDHGELEIDNNLVENCMRPLKLGANYANMRIM